MLSYFYIIKFLETDQYYAGSRYTKTLTETNINNDLWKRYFTSSKIIKILIKTFGKNAFVIEKIKIFNNQYDAKNYEIRFLKRIDAKNNPKMLNQSNSVFENSPELKWITNGEVSTMIPKVKPLFPGFRLGRTQPTKKISKNQGPRNRIHVIDIKTNDRMMILKNEFDSSKYQKSNQAYNKGRTWIYNPETGESKIIKDISNIPNGWIKGNPRRKKSRWYHDPETQINYQLKEKEIPTPNLKKGRFYPYVWYTNPETKSNILCKLSDEPPVGYVKGRTLPMKGHR